MKSQPSRQQHNLIGLWRIWDILPDEPDPRGRRPEALLERYAGVFDAPPTDKQIRGTLVREEDALRPDLEASELIGHIVVNDKTWDAFFAEGGWNRQGERRHGPGSALIANMQRYGLTSEQIVSEGSVWALAADYGPPIQGVADSLERLADAMGLPKAEFGPEVPFFERRAGETSEREQRRERERT